MTNFVTESNLFSVKYIFNRNKLTEDVSTESTRKSAHLTKPISNNSEEERTLQMLVRCQLSTVKATGHYYGPDWL